MIMKATNIVIATIAALALVGDIVFMYILVLAGEAMSAFSTLPDPELQGMGQTISMMLTLGWVWTILVLITCLFAIKLAVIDSRKKK
jgi:hypothetical protein